MTFRTLRESVTLPYLRIAEVAALCLEGIRLGVPTVWLSRNRACKLSCVSAQGIFFLRSSLGYCRLLPLVSLPIPRCTAAFRSGCSSGGAAFGEFIGGSRVLLSGRSSGL